MFEPEKVVVEIASPDDVFPIESVELRNDVTKIGNRRRGKYRIDYRFQVA